MRRGGSSPLRTTTPVVRRAPVRKRRKPHSGGDPAVFDRLEKKLGDMYGRPGGVLLFQSGWHANSGILPALAAATPPKRDRVRRGTAKCTRA